MGAVKPNVDLVAVILATALFVVLAIIAATALINTINPATNITSTLGENTTQILSASTGAIVGVLGTYMGYRAGERKHRNGDPES
jgi:ABC-type nickel/cobalt efflux system permease component RcnA